MTSANGEDERPSSGPPKKLRTGATTAPDRTAKLERIAASLSRAPTRQKALDCVMSFMPLPVLLQVERVARMRVTHDTFVVVQHLTTDLCFRLLRLCSKDVCESSASDLDHLRDRVIRGFVYLLSGTDHSIVLDLLWRDSSRCPYSNSEWPLVWNSLCKDHRHCGGAPLREIGEALRDYESYSIITKKRTPYGTMPSKRAVRVEEFLTGLCEPKALFSVLECVSSWFLEFACMSNSLLEIVVRPGLSLFSLESYDKAYFAALSSKSIALARKVREPQTLWIYDRNVRRLLIDMWLHGIPPGDPVWNKIHAIPIMCVGKVDQRTKAFMHKEDSDASESDDDFGLLPPNCAYIVELVDGSGVGHKLVFDFNQGDADANTGIFGHALSARGIWVTFAGDALCDSGTLVTATDLALHTFVPHNKDFPQGLLPAKSTWTDNKFTFGSQVELICFAVAMLCMKRPPMAFTGVGASLARNSLKSLLTIVFRKVVQQNNLSALIPSSFIEQVARLVDPKFPIVNNSTTNTNHPTKTTTAPTIGDPWPYGQLKPYPEQIKLWRSGKDSNT
ncbi:hypothetical protein Pelo_1123 [Pelomyxa schiedti]|nr:hypothetical protein Pelo_1123 [Pelomyxa schiedti]